MLNFFRTYQRYFFFFIAIVIVISFSFFGTHATLGPVKQVEDSLIGQACDGSQMKRQEIDEIVRFIATDSQDTQLQEKRQIPNFLNDGVIRRDFFSTGLAVMLVEHYFKALEKDFAKRVKQHKNYRLYKHPSSPFISVKSLLEEILPLQKKRLDQFLSDKEGATPKIFSLLVDLYLEEKALPPSILRQYLIFQQKQHHWIDPDPHLRNRNLNLFYCTSLEDWFGRDFIELVAQFIHNGAIIAQERGYHVSKEEARSNLLQNGYQAFKKQTNKEVVNQTEFAAFFKQQLFSLQLDEKQALRVWQKVMLLRRLFQDCASASLFDTYQYKAFHSYASKTAFIDVYQLQSSMQIKDFESLLELVFYLDVIGKKREAPNDLPKVFKTVGEVEEKYPELVQKRYLVEVAKVTENEVTLHIPIKRIWEWQLKKENFNRLKKHFGFLKGDEWKGKENFFIALEGLTLNQREKIDAFSRTLILKESPEWVEKAFDKASLETKEIAISSKGTPFFIEGIQDGKELQKLLEKSPFKKEITDDKVKVITRKELECYSQDGNSFFRFYLLDRDKEKSIMTFEEARKRQILTPLLETILESHYRAVRSKNPLVYQNKSGSWKPFDEVKDEAGKDFYRFLLQTIDQDFAQGNHALSPKRLIDLNFFYPHYFFYKYMNQALKDLQIRGGKSRYLLKKKNEDEQKEERLSKQSPLQDQFLLRLVKKVHKNYEKGFFFDETLFTMVEKGWSSVKKSEKEGLGFFQLQEKRVPEESYLNEIKKGGFLLGGEAKRFLMDTILKELKKRGGIHLMRKEDAQ